MGKQCDAHIMLCTLDHTTLEASTGSKLNAGDFWVVVRKFVIRVLRLSQTISLAYSDHPRRVPQENGLLFIYSNKICT